MLIASSIRWSSWLTATVLITAKMSRADDAELRPARPAVQMNRGLEDWSALADPGLRTRPLDSFKYVPLWSRDRQVYLSFGLTLRERFEVNDAPRFGVMESPRDSYLLQRLQVHADLHFAEHWNLFVQLEDVRAFAKTVIGPADENPLDVRQAYLAYHHPFGAGTLKVRVGRQHISVDLQRFISLRDGPNVQQSFDAIWAAW